MIMKSNYEFNSSLLPDGICTFPHKQVCKYEKGNYIYLPDDLSIHMYILKQGAVKIGSYSPAGKEVMFDCILPAEFFGNLKFLSGDFFSEYAKALVDIEVIEIKVSHFKELVQRDLDVANWVHEIMTLRWYRAESRLFRISSEKPVERVRYLLPLLEQQLTDTRGQNHSISNLLSYQDIADLCGISRQSAARHFKELRGKTNT